MLVLNRVLANLSVESKLSLGFGLVLLVALGVAVTTFRSLSVLQQRCEQSRQESSIQALMPRARIAEKAFALDLAPQRLDQVRETIGKLSQQLGFLKGWPENGICRPISMCFHQQAT